MEISRACQASAEETLAVLLFSRHNILVENTLMRNWRTRLTLFQQRIYDRSASISSVPLLPTPQLFAATAALENALKAENEQQVQALSQTIVSHICSGLGVRTTHVQVQGVRPSNRRGELHGLYTQYGEGSPNDSIQVWMRTAKRGQVVAFRTFLRTLLHEVCHHLDYTYFHLRESYHTEGFFQRESSLFYTVVQQPVTEPPKPRPSLSTMVKEILTTHGQHQRHFEDSGQHHLDCSNEPGKPAEKEARSHSPSKNTQ